LISVSVRRRGDKVSEESNGLLFLHLFFGHKIPSKQAVISKALVGDRSSSGEMRGDHDHVPIAVSRGMTSPGNTGASASALNGTLNHSIS